MMSCNRTNINACFILTMICLLTSCGSFATPKPFWDQLGIQSEDLEEIRLTYRGQDVVLDAGDTGRFVQALTQSEPTTVDENHEFTPSDIGVTFAAGGKEYPVTFYWFPYYDNPGEELGVISSSAIGEQTLYQRIGNRFDMVLNGKKYHYRFTSDAVWTEQKMRDMYDRYASIAHLPSRAQLDGADRGYNRGGLVTSEKFSLEEILSQSDWVILATYEGSRRDDSFENRPNLCYDWERFLINEMLKGDIATTWFELPSQSRGKVFNYGNRNCIAYPVVYAPDFIEGTQYLICARDSSYHNERYFGQYTTAVLDGDTLFPRFNTEDHPFYNVKLQEVRDRIAENNEDNMP